LLSSKKTERLISAIQEYVRVDLVMYGVMVLLIILYFIYSVLSKKKKKPRFGGLS